MAALLKISVSRPILPLKPFPSWSQSEEKAPCRTDLLKRVKEVLADVDACMLMQMMAQAMETIWLTRDGQL